MDKDAMIIQGEQGDWPPDIEASQDAQPSG